MLSHVADIITDYLTPRDVCSDIVYGTVFLFNKESSQSVNCGIRQM